jgi:hypothetical protein
MCDLRGRLPFLGGDLTSDGIQTALRGKRKTETLGDLCVR